MLSFCLRVPAGQLYYKKNPSYLLSGSGETRPNSLRAKENSLYLKKDALDAAASEPGGCAHMYAHVRVHGVLQDAAKQE